MNKRAILLMLVIALTGCASPVKSGFQNDMSMRVDRIAASLQGRTTHKDAANAPIFIKQDDRVNASTDGQAVYITSGLMTSVSDLALALIIAHELGHISLNHYYSQNPPEQLEQEADRYGLFVLARAGLDYQSAARLSAAAQPPHKHGQPASGHEASRAANFRATIAEIKALKAKDAPIKP